MKRLTITQKVQALNNALRSFNIPEKYFILNSDKRMGAKFTIATSTANGGVSIQTNYMTYEEMNCYLMGYNTAVTMPF